MRVVEWVSISLLCGLLGANASASDQSKPASESARTSAADNTARNARDRGDATLTPDDQGESKSDLETTRKIRRALIKNDELSMTAKNIKIITKNGKVTLRGPVKTQHERDLIDKIAQQEGITSLDNRLEVTQAKE